MAKPILGVIILAVVLFSITALFSSILVINNYEYQVNAETPLAIIHVREGKSATVQFTSPGNHTIVFAARSGQIVQNLTLHSEPEANSIFQKAYELNAGNLTRYNIAFIEVDDNVYPVEWEQMSLTIGKRFSTLQVMAISVGIGVGGFVIGYIATKGGKRPLLSE